MPRATTVITFILLVFSALGVTLSGPLILGIYSPRDKFWNLGPAANLIGGALDIMGGLAQFAILAHMTRKRYFSVNTDREAARKAFRLMAMTCIIGTIGDLIGGLLAIAAQIGLYTSLLNARSLSKKETLQ